MAFNSQSTTIPFSFNATEAIQLAKQHELDLAFTKPHPRELTSLSEFDNLKAMFPEKNYSVAELKEKLEQIDKMQRDLKIANIPLKKKEALDYLYDLVKLQIMQAFYKKINNGEPLEEKKVEPLASWGKRFKCYLFAGFALAAEGADGFFGIHDFFATILRISNAILGTIVSVIGFLLKAFAYTAVEVSGFTEEMGCSKQAILPRFMLHEKMLLMAQAINNKLAQEDRTSNTIFSMTQLFGMCTLFNKMMGRKNAVVHSYTESNATKRARLWVGRVCALIDGIFSFVVVQNFFLMLGLAFAWTPAGVGILLGCAVIAAVTAYLEYKSSMPLGFFKFFNKYAEMQDRLKHKIDSFEDEKNVHHTKEWQIERIENVIKEDIDKECKWLSERLNSIEPFEKVETKRINDTIAAIYLKVKEVEAHFADPMQRLEDSNLKIFDLKKRLQALIDLSLEVKCNNIQLKLDIFKQQALITEPKINQLELLSDNLLSTTNTLWINDCFFALQSEKLKTAKEKISREITSLKEVSFVQDRKDCQPNQRKAEITTVPFYSCTKTTSNLFQLQRKPRTIELTELSSVWQCKSPN